jgi:uncharacterized protein YjiS (DUF1127 family)
MVGNKNKHPRQRDMAYYTETIRHSFSERLMTTFARFFDRAAARLAHHRIYCTTLAELQVLSDRDLADLGLNRSTLKNLAMETADKTVQLN